MPDEDKAKSVHPISDGFYVAESWNRPADSDLLDRDRKLGAEQRAKAWNDKYGSGSVPQPE